MATVLTTSQAAKELGVSPRRIQALIKAGRLQAERLGREYMVKPADLAKIRVRKPGRPRKK